MPKEPVATLERLWSVLNDLERSLAEVSALGRHIKGSVYKALVEVVPGWAPPAMDAQEKRGPKGPRRSLMARNADIAGLRAQGWSVKALAERYKLSPASIHNIIKNDPLGRN